MDTRRLYEEDAYLHRFSARIAGVRACGGRYGVVLDRTAFFPEGGGQPGDVGRIGDLLIVDTQWVDGEICHLTDTEPTFPEGAIAICDVDWELRFARMQSHTGEHIVSGQAHRLFGAENVGFHMDGLVMTVDFDRPLTKADLRVLEERANAVVYRDLPVRAWFPSEEESRAIDYRSKLETVERLRLVEIRDCDVCACCAPHVSSTGAVGLIRIHAAVSHRGGVRLTLLCGLAAFRDYREKAEQIAQISAALKTPQAEACEGVRRLCEKYEARGRALMAMRRQELDRICESLPFTQGNAVRFEEALGTDELRRMADACKEKCGGVFAVFSGDDENGYFTMLASVE